MGDVAILRLTFFFAQQMRLVVIVFLATFYSYSIDPPLADIWNEKKMKINFASGFNLSRI